MEEHGVVELMQALSLGDALPAPPLLPLVVRDLLSLHEPIQTMLEATEALDVEGDAHEGFELLADGSRPVNVGGDIPCCPVVVHLIAEPTSNRLLEYIRATLHAPCQ